MVYPPPSSAPPPRGASARPRQERYTAGAWADPPQPPPWPTRIAVPANPKAILWVSRLPASVSEADLRATFSPYGDIVRLTINHKASTTFAHVAFASPHDAAAALRALDGRPPTLLSSDHLADPSVARPSPMRIEYALTEDERRSSGLFRQPQTPEPSHGINRPGAPSGASVKPEPSPGPQQPPSASHTRRPSYAGSRPPLPSQAEALKRGAAAQVARDAPPKKRHLPPHVSYVQVDDALKIDPPPITHLDRTLETIGPGRRTCAQPGQHASTPAVAYTCTYRLPAGLPADASASRTIAFARTARDELAASDITLVSWDIVPTSAAYASSAQAPPAAQQQHHIPTFRAVLVIPPERVALLSIDTYVQDKRRRFWDQRNARAAERVQAAVTAASATHAASDGAFVLRVAMPPACFGPSAEATKARRAWLGAQARKWALEGKAVLATNVDERDQVCEIRYLPPEEEEESAKEGSARDQEYDQEMRDAGDAEGDRSATAAPERVPERAPGRAPEAVSDSGGTYGARVSPLPSTAAVGSAAASMDEDVKPIIRHSPPVSAPVVPPPPRSPSTESDADVDQLATPTPEPEGDIAPSRFPLPLLVGSKADSDHTRQVVDRFLQEYFRRFDESRGTLEYLYTPNALFSLKLDPSVPARLRSSSQPSPTPFELRWLQGANRVSSTPIAITNAIRGLPPGSHDLSRARYTASTVPELHVRKQQPLAPLVVHLVGEFEEFPDKTVRGFNRTFILVPKGAGAGGGAAEYWVHSDQLTMRYFVPGEPRPVLVAFPPFSPNKASTSTQPRPRAPPEVGGLSPSARSNSAATSRPSSVTSNGTPRPFAQLQPHPGLARLQYAHQPGPGPVGGQDPSADAPRQPVAPQAPGSADSVLPPPQGKRRRASSASPGPMRLQAVDTAADLDGATALPHEMVILTDSYTSTSGDSDSDADQTGSPSPVAPSPPPPPPVEPDSRPRKRRAGSPSAARTSDTVSSADASDGGGGRPSTAERAVEAGLLSRAEVERLIQLEVAAQMQRLTGRGDGTGVAGRAGSSSSDAAASEPSLNGRGTESSAGKRVRASDRTTMHEDASALRRKEEEEEAARKRKIAKVKEKEKRERARKEKEKRDRGPELGTGVGKTDARILIPGSGNAQLHGFDGRGNKLRHMVNTGSSLLAVSHLGDIVEFACHSTSLASTVRKLHSSKDDKFRVDDFAWSDAKDSLLVGYLGAKEGKELVRPAHQVVLYRRDETVSGSTLVPTGLNERPHTAGGVTAIATLPGAGRLRFITGGEDKKLFLWTRSRASQDIKTANIRSEHSSMITSIAPIVHQDWVVSGAKDKRVFAYDLDRMASTWQALLHSPVMTVSQVPSDPHLILARVSAPSNQFTIFDMRSSKKGVIQFGYDLAPHTTSTGALSPTTMGRYYRGDQCDTIYAFPDYESGVKLWDLRNVRTTMTDNNLKKQHLHGLARSKVVQTMFRGRTELDLLEMAHFSRLSIRG